MMLDQFVPKSLIKIGSRMLPSAPRALSNADLCGYRNAQKLAFEAVRSVASLIQPGWTEQQAAILIDTYLRDCGVSSFFHFSFVWFGNRTKFQGISSYSQFQPSQKRLKEDDVFILDVAPVLNKYAADIGYSGCLVPREDFKAASDFLAKLKKLIPSLFLECASGSEVWRRIDAAIRENGYENIHARYPFSVLGHRLHRVTSEQNIFSLLHFGWQSYVDFLSRGLFTQLLSPEFEGNLSGLWAIEPHIATPGDDGFGVKFEEILVVEKSKVYWLAKNSDHQ